METLTLLRSGSRAGRAAVSIAPMAMRSLLDCAKIKGGGCQGPLFTPRKAGLSHARFQLVESSSWAVGSQQLEPWAWTISTTGFCRRTHRDLWSSTLSLECCWRFDDKS